MIRSGRFFWVSFLSLISFLLLITRLGYLQIYCHADLLERAERIHSRRHGISEEERGQILDRSGKILAMSIQGGACFADPHRLTDPDEAARAVAAVLGVPEEALRAKFLERKRFVWIARRLDPEMTQRLQELKIPGVQVISEPKRFYPEEKLAAHVLGVVGEDQQGLSGVEQMADLWLDNGGMPTFFKTWEWGKTASWHPKGKVDLAPNSVVLTLDRTLQYIVEQELAAQMTLSRPRSGTVVMQDPYTGEILAMASAPPFNPNLWGTPAMPKDNGPETLKNPAIEKVFEPGSTFKLVAASGVLEEKIMRPSDPVNCEYGEWETQGRVIHDHEKDGTLTFTDVLTHSSNIGTAKIAMRLGQEHMYRYARAFGFGTPSGCGLPGDGSGILRNPQQWRTGSLMTISFGQEVGVTPLQMVNAYSVIANGGWLMEPRLYKGVVDHSGRYREWETNRPIRRVVSERTTQMMRSIFKEVVERGTGKAAAVAGIPTAGKTGTAQKIDPETHQYSPDRYIASFCGFVPVDHPKVAICAFLDEPKGSYWGGSEAAPLFSRIVRDAAPYLQIESHQGIGPMAILKTPPRS